MSWNPEDVVSAPGANDPNLQRTLAASEALERDIWAILDPENYEVGFEGADVAACFAACQLCFEHGQAVRGLISAGFDSSAGALLRVQFEAVTRAHWALYAATEDELERLTAPLSPEAEKAASDLPTAGKMINAMRDAGPPGMHEMFDEFKKIVLSTLHALVHVGQPSLILHAHGYPVDTLDRMARYSNAFQSMAGMAMATISGDEAKIAAMRVIQKPHEACLPHLLRNSHGGQPAAS